MPLILKYRKRSKFNDTYVRGLLQQADKNDRVHTNFNVAVTATGRLSSSAPNLQNITRGAEARNIFVATPGYTLIDADESQAEVRTWCLYARDENLRSAILSGIDLHKATACLMYNLKPEEVTDVLRTGAKRLTFGTLYQMSEQGLVAALEQDGINISLQAIEMQKLFFSKYSRGREWIEDVKATVLRTGIVETFYGRRRHFPYISADNRAEVQRQTVNFPIQSATSDILLMALNRISDKCRAGAYGDTRLLLTVHDSILLETAEEDYKSVALDVKMEMEEAGTR